MALDQITSEGQLESAIKDHRSFIIIFSAIWSQLGEATKANFEKVGAKHATLYQAWISTDSNPNLAENHGVKEISTVIGFKDGAQVEEYVGPQLMEHQVEAFIQKVL
ncbi:hypothetical protein BDW71DRAFT_202931 [Aspergillus fruticulosus]